MVYNINGLNIIIAAKLRKASRGRVEEKLQYVHVRVDK